MSPYFFLSLFIRLEVYKNILQSSLRGLFEEDCFITSSPHHTFRIKQARQCLDRPLKGQLRYAFTYSFGFVLTKPFSKEKPLKKLLKNLLLFILFLSYAAAFRLALLNLNDSPVRSIRCIIIDSLRPTAIAAFFKPYFFMSLSPHTFKGLHD